MRVIVCAMFEEHLTTTLEKSAEMFVGLHIKCL